jgi:hypothetical protein
LKDMQQVDAFLVVLARVAIERADVEQQSSERGFFANTGSPSEGCEGSGEKGFLAEAFSTSRGVGLRYRVCEGSQASAVWVEHTLFNLRPLRGGF